MSMKESALSNATCYRKQGHPQNAEQGQGWEQTDTNDTLNAFDNCEGRTPTVVLENHPADSRVKICKDGIVQTLSSRMGTGGGNVPMVMEPQCVGNGQLAQARLQDTVGTLNCMHDQQAVLVNERESMEEQNKSVVRRLTPLECERLQGYPDGWTDIGEWVDTKGKKHKDADSPRYKALGNSIGLPYWSWMAERMVKQLKADGVENPTMASLFDGIGGFPLVYSRCGCKPVWASEVEEFCIAVTKRRFPDEDMEESSDT